MATAKITGARPRAGHPGDSAPDMNEALRRARPAVPALSPADQAAHELAGCRTRPSAGGPLTYKRRDVAVTMSRVLGR